MLNYVSERYKKSKLNDLNIKKGMFQEIVNEANIKFKTNEKISIKTIQSRYHRKIFRLSIVELLLQWHH